MAKYKIGPKRERGLSRPVPQAPSASSAPSESGAVDRGLVRPQWRKKMELRRQEEGPRRPVPEQARSPSFWERLWEPFNIWADEGKAEGPHAPLSEILVPRAEREYVKRRAGEYARGIPGRQAPGYSTYAAVPGQERPSYARPPRPDAGERPRYERPAGERPVYERPKAAPRAPGVAGPDLVSLVTPEYVNQIFNFEKLFAHVRELIADPKFDGSAGIGVIAPAGIDPWGKVLETAKFFGIPESAYMAQSRDTVWVDVFEPFLSEVIRGLNLVKPADIPGKLVFGTSPRGAFGLIYTSL